MQIHETLECAVFTTREEPIDGSLLVHGQVIFIKPCRQIPSECVSGLFALNRTKAVRNESQVLFQVLRRPRHADERHHAGGHVLLDTPIGFE